MSKYAPQIATALRLIEAKGASLTLTRNPEAVDTGASENPWDADFTDQTGAGANDEALTYTIKAVILPERGGRDLGFEEGAAVETSARKLLVAASGLAITPRPGDKIAIGGDDFHVIGVSTLDPDGAGAIYHRVTARK